MSVANEVVVIREKTLAAETRLHAAVKSETVDVQLDAFLLAYINLATQAGLIEEAGKQLLQVGASIVWREAFADGAKQAEQRPCDAALH